ncbi:hypothetical protein [Nocardia sp. NPDC058705]|uniref:hypothetical protein n=1 Tax=Nocardia sp. NPDC058705 TaxID=3346609 RepID=UPI00367880DF
MKQGLSGGLRYEFVFEALSIACRGAQHSPTLSSSKSGLSASSWDCCTIRSRCHLIVQQPHVLPLLHGDDREYNAAVILLEAGRVHCGPDEEYQTVDRLTLSPEDRKY